MDDIENICEDLSSRPTIRESWNDWLASYSNVIIQDKNRSLKVGHLPFYNGNRIMDFKNHLLGIYNNDRKHFLLIGMLLEKNHAEGAIEAIQNSNVSDLFFPQTGKLPTHFTPSQLAVDTVKLSTPSQLSVDTVKLPITPKTSLQRLAERTTKSEAALKTVLTGDVSKKVCELVPWLLPDVNMTLLNLVDQYSDAWLDLIVVLVRLAERKLYRTKFTFTHTNHLKDDLRKAITKIKCEAPPLELLIYDPSKDAESRKREWRDKIFDFVNQQALLKIEDDDDDEDDDEEVRSFEDLHLEHQEELITKFTDTMSTDKKLLDSVIQSMLCSGGQVAQLDTLEDTLFPPKQKTIFATHSQYKMPPVVWSVDGCIDKVKKATKMTADTAAKLKAILYMWHLKGLFDIATNSMLYDTLKKECKATPTEIVLIIQDLIENGIMK